MSDTLASDKLTAVSARPRALTFGVARLAGAVPALLAAAGLALALRRPRFADLVTGHLVGDAAMAVACGVVAAVILARRPRHPVGVLFAAIGVSDGVSALSGGVSALSSPGDTGYRWTVWLAEWTWVPGLALTVAVLPLVFPDGPATRFRRIALRVEVGLIAAACLGQALGTRLQSGPHHTIANPLGVRGADMLGNAALGLLLVGAATSLVLLVVRLVRADATTRPTLLPLVAAGIVVVAATSADRSGSAGAVVQDAAYLLIPAAALLSVLRLHLYDLELALGRITSWLLLSALLVGGYVLVVEVASSRLHLHGRVSSVLATAFIALAFGPLRASLQRLVARWLYGDRGDPYAALAHTTQVLAAGADPVGALHRATGDLAHRLRSPGVRIVRSGTLLAGHAGGRPVLRVPLRSGGDVVAHLEILPRAPGETFSAADERLIVDLSVPLSNAVAAVAVAEELRAARERLARTREDERRRVRGELHDGVGPTLAAAGVQARVALNRLGRRDPGGATEALAALQTVLVQAAGDLRAATDALGPAVLDEVGLAGAISSLADADATVAVDVEPLPDLPAAVETAAYRVVAEALTNARRHASARHIEVHVSASPDALHLRVSDDGVGLADTSVVGRGACPPARGAGLGLASMRARVEELGGVLRVGAGEDGRGTVVSARLPLSDMTRPT